MLDNLLNNHGQANWAGLVGRTMANLTGTNSFVNPSPAHTYATIPANNATTLANSGLLPAHGLIQDWGDISGHPTDAPVTAIAAGGGAVPIVLPEIRIGNVIYWFRNNYPTILRERRWRLE